MGAAEAKQAILDNRTALGIEFGSTRIKAVLVDGNNAPIASGGHEWENRYENGVWTYSLEDIWSGLQDCYQQMAKDVEEKYGVELTSVGALPRCQPEEPFLHMTDTWQHLLCIHQALFYILSPQP